MRILMLISSLDTGGAETHVVELSLALMARGHSVTVVSAYGELCHTLKKHGIEHVIAELSSHAPFSLARAYFTVRKLIRTGDFDVIHAHSRIAAYIGEMAARREKKLFVTTVHAFFSVTPFTKRFSRWGYRSIAVSEDLAEYLSDNYCVSADKISIIPNGIDIERFCPSKKKGRSIVFVSRLDSDCSDAAYSLCRIAEHLCRRYSGISIKIVGGGSEYERISEIARETNAKVGFECVKAVGGVSDIRSALSDALVFVGVSRCALEAMSMGIPTLLAGNEGMLGTVREENIMTAKKSNFCGRGECGIDDVRLFSELCELLDTEGEKREALSGFLRDYVKKHNSIDAVCDATVSFYERAAESVSLRGKGVCLCGYYGYRNVGDDILLELSAKRARERFGKDTVVAFTHDPRFSRYRFGIPCVNRYNIFSLLRALCRSHTLVFGGGTLFQDRTSFRSMLYYLFVAELAFVLGKRVELWGNGLSKPRYATSRYLQKRLIRRCDYIGVRDKPSLALAKKYGAKPEKVCLEGDMALGIKAEECQRSFRTDSLLKDIRRSALFCLSGELSAKGREYFKKRAEQAKRNGITPIVAVMHQKSDFCVCSSFARDIGAVFVSGLSARELVCLLRSAEYCVSSRLHPLVFSYIAGTRFEGVSLDSKVGAFCEEYEGQWHEL